MIEDQQRRAGTGPSREERFWAETRAPGACIGASNPGAGFAAQDSPIAVVLDNNDG